MRKIKSYNSWLKKTYGPNWKWYKALKDRKIIGNFIRDKNRGKYSNKY